MADNGVIQETVQSRVRDDEIHSLDIIPLLLRANDLIPQWWSRQRDIELSRFWKQSDHVSSAISMFISKVASIPVKIVPKDASIKSHVKEADLYNALLLDGSDFFKGWHASLAPRTVENITTQDNGIFWEIIGGGRDKSKMREGPMLGLANLDSQRCTRTSSPEHPVLYRDTDGKLYKLHYSRVAYAAAMPSGIATMNGVGFCALSRMVATAQHLVDLATTEQEEMGSRPKRQIMVAEQGITASDLAGAILSAEQTMDNQGLKRYSRTVIVGPKHAPTAANPTKIAVHELKKALSGEDKRESITLGMFLIALALNVPPRWLWPATQAGATKADAMFQHVAGMGGGVGLLLLVLKSMLGGDSLATKLKKPIPSHLDIVFDFQDDEQDRQKSEISKVRSETRERDLNAGTIDTRIARLQMLENGELSEAEFEDLELRDGRLADGQDAINLFLSPDRDIQEMLTLSVPDVLNVEANDPLFVEQQIKERMIMLRAELIAPSRPAMFRKATQAMAALEALEKLYKPEPEPQQLPLPMNGEPMVEAPPEAGAGMAGNNKEGE